MQFVDSSSELGEGGYRLPEEFAQFITLQALSACCRHLPLVERLSARSPQVIDDEVMQEGMTVSCHRTHFVQLIPRLPQTEEELAHRIFGALLVSVVHRQSLPLQVGTQARHFYDKPLLFHRYTLKTNEPSQTYHRQEKFFVFFRNICVNTLVKRPKRMCYFWAEEAGSRPMMRLTTRAMAPSPVTLQAVPKLSMAI